ncbi:hypothetical protein GPECTOR_10g1106 [Gonium pectorale]|uniref:Ion transport domain-containing protein n=1 Tax=Gonium pectorale TaxID=33097 RepID=A0A150GQM5_GONPE|nr:hypothetical protein GPECTOR_10g1106 [Gonium pectorale]|eukprot:KXZ52083.1 hypothetical protein GPECTOR_10g1106 [Gonium pectorale]
MATTSYSDGSLQKWKLEVCGAAVLEDGSLAVTSAQLEAEQAEVLLWRPEANQPPLALVQADMATGYLDSVDITRVRRRPGPQAKHPRPAVAGLAKGPAETMTLVAATGLRGVLYVWEGDSGALLYSAAVSEDMRSCCRFSPCGAFLLLGGYASGELILVESLHGQELMRVHTVQEPGDFNTPASCFFLPDQPPRASLRPRQPGTVEADHVGAKGATPVALHGQPPGYPAFESRYYDVQYATSGDRRVIGASGSAASAASGDGGCGKGLPGLMGSRGSRNKVSDSSGFTQTGAELKVEAGTGSESGSGSDQAFPTRLGAVCADGSLRLFDLGGDAFDDGLAKDDRMSLVYDADVSDDGTIVAVVYGEAGDGEARPPELRVFNFATGELLLEVPHEREGTYGMFVQLSGVAALARAADGGGAAGLVGKAAAALSDKHVHIFDLQNGGRLLDIDTGHGYNGVCPRFNAAFDRMLTSCSAGDAWIGLWDVVTGQLIARHTAVHREVVFDAMFSADGTKGVSAACDKTAAIFEADTGKVLKRFVGHGHWVRCAVLSPDEKSLATCSNDCTARLWDVAKATCLHVVRGFGQTVTSVVWAHPTWLVGAARDGRILGFNLQTGTSLPLHVGGPVTGGGEGAAIDSAEKLSLLPASASSGGSKLPGMLAITRNGSVLTLNLAPRQPLPHQVRNEYVKGVWTLDHVATLARAFPGLALVPEGAGGDTLLHWAVERGDEKLLRVLVTSGGAIARAPLPANAHAWSRLAEHMPQELTRFLLALSVTEATDARGAPTVLVPAGDGSKQLRTLGSQPVVPSLCGLPYMAAASPDPEATPFGALVTHGLSEALESDIGFAVLSHKWETFAGAIYRRHAWQYCVFLVLYIAATTAGVLWDPHVDRGDMYGGSGGRLGRSVGRGILEGLVLVLNTYFLYGELKSLVRRGARRYFKGYTGLWNVLELVSGSMVWLIVLLQVIGSVEEARWLMSGCTVLLGVRLIKVASGFEGTGIYVQIILRIVVDLRYFLLIVAVTLVTYALAFRQVMVYFEQVAGEEGISEDFRSSFSGFPASLLTVYYFMTIGISSYAQGSARFVWYLHVLLGSFSFLVSIIMLNLIIAIMSDTYTVVQQHARSEWLLLKARLVAEIESELPGSFFEDLDRCCPRWLHVVNLKRSSGPGAASLLETVRGATIRQALNKDVTESRQELVQRLDALGEGLRALQGDVARLAEAMSSAERAATVHTKPPAQPPHCHRARSRHSSPSHLLAREAHEAVGMSYVPDTKT